MKSILILTILSISAWSSGAQNPSKSVDSALSGVFQEGFKHSMFVIDALDKQAIDEDILVLPHTAACAIVIKVLDMDKGVLSLQLASQGSVLHEATFESSGAAHYVPFKDLAAGTYWLTITEPERSEPTEHRYKIEYTPRK